LKHRLPDADPDFIDRFADMVEEYKLKKAESVNLKELNNPIPKGSKPFKGKHVAPGEVEIITGPFEGSKIKLLHMDDKYAYVEPFKAGDQSAVGVNKLNRKLENSYFRVSKKPEQLKIPNYVHGEQHAHPQLTETLAQRHLMHGIDLAGEPLAQTHPHGATEARTKGAIGWYRSAHGRMGYVKPAVTFPHDEMINDQQNFISTADRETIFHNVARNFWQLGEHTATTGSFKHPQTGHPHSISELIPKASHVQIKNRGAEANERLKIVGDTGALDKLAIMDISMGHADRNKTNYLTSPNHPGVHLHDNQLIFNFQDDHIPAYQSDYHKLKDGSDFMNQEMHPEAIKYLLSLDPFALGAELTRQGVSPQYSNKSVARLMSMQSEAIVGKRRKGDILYAHTKYLKTKNPLPAHEAPYEEINA